jgi:hypothetical protein
VSVLSDGMAGLDNIEAKKRRQLNNLALTLATAGEHASCAVQIAVPVSQRTDTHTTHTANRITDPGLGGDIRAEMREHLCGVMCVSPSHLSHLRA